jgi:hypothetical protein
MTKEMGYYTAEIIDYTGYDKQELDNYKLQHAIMGTAAHGYHNSCHTEHFICQEKDTLAYCVENFT